MLSPWLRGHRHAAPPVLAGNLTTVSGGPSGPLLGLELPRPPGVGGTGHGQRRGSGCLWNWKRRESRSNCGQKTKRPLGLGHADSWGPFMWGYPAWFLLPSLDSLPPVSCHPTLGSHPEEAPGWLLGPKQGPRCLWKGWALLVGDSPGVRKQVSPAPFWRPGSWGPERGSPSPGSICSLAATAPFLCPQWPGDIRS